MKLAMRLRLSVGLAAALAGAALTVLQAGPAAGASASTAPTFHSAAGLSLISAQADGPRTWRLSIRSEALSRPVDVDVLLPTDYASTTRRYPSVYLEHGTSGRASDWLEQGNAAAATALYPMIVVMPDAGYSGNGGSWFTNWVDQGTALGTANWETFHIDQLIPFIDDNLRTMTSRDARAIAGLSQGGFGSFSYAARHPDLFVAAASFSGAPDIDSNLLVKTAATAVISATATGLDGVEPNAMFGDPASNDINWQGHNPASLVTNLGATDLRLWSGNGLPGPLDNLMSAVSGAVIEGVVHASTLSFAQVASAAHVPFVFNDYGPGTHSWTYWSRDLTEWLPHLAAVFAAPPAVPSSITYRCVDRSWTQWGWTVATHRVPAQAFSALTDASRGAFSFTGAPATVRTPSFYAPGSVHVITVTGGSAPPVATADRQGQLSIDVSPASPQQPTLVAIARG
ncbi:MAG: esterase family protein [Actinomycetota bacterium]|nr:esterase family protein [Actinomycetota bacterium]